MTGMMYLGTKYLMQSQPHRTAPWLTSEEMARKDLRDHSTWADNSVFGNYLLR